MMNNFVAERLAVLPVTIGGPGKGMGLVVNPNQIVLSSYVGSDAITQFLFQENGLTISGNLVINDGGDLVGGMVQNGNRLFGSAWVPANLSASYPATDLASALALLNSTVAALIGAGIST